VKTSQALVLALLVVTLAGAASQGSAAYDVFVRLDGQAGECAEAGHRTWIPGTAFSVPLVHDPDGLLMPTHTVQITRPVDGTSRALASACAAGRYFKYAALAVRKTGKGAPSGDYFLATFFKVYITAYASSGSRTAATERLELSFGKVVWQYRPPGPRGTLGPVDSGGYNGVSGQCFPDVGVMSWTGRRLGDPALPLPTPVAFPLIAARVILAGS
jgi:type VI protein secretion system component Hcp